MSDLIPWQHLLAEAPAAIGLSVFTNGWLQQQRWQHV